MSVPNSFSGNENIYYSIENMLQGLAFWMGYRYECYAGHSITEGAIIEIAVGILGAHLDHQKYAIQCEYQYKKFNSKGNNERADIVILEKKNKSLTPICVMEFKRASDTRDVWSDLNKLCSVSSNIKRLAVLVARGNPSIVQDFITIGAQNKERSKKIVKSKKKVTIYK